MPRCLLSRGKPNSVMQGTSSAADLDPASVVIGGAVFTSAAHAGKAKAGS